MQEDAEDQKQQEHIFTLENIKRLLITGEDNRSLFNIRRSIFDKGRIKRGMTPYFQLFRLHACIDLIETQNIKKGVLYYLYHDEFPDLFRQSEGGRVCVSQEEGQSTTLLYFLNQCLNDNREEILLVKRVIAYAMRKYPADERQLNFLLVASLRLQQSRHELIEMIKIDEYILLLHDQSFIRKVRMKGKGREEILDMIRLINESDHDTGLLSVKLKSFLCNYLQQTLCFLNLWYLRDENNFLEIVGLRLKEDRRRSSCSQMVDEKRNDSDESIGERFPPSSSQSPALSPRSPISISQLD